jgi:hypothetical protein
MKSTQRPSKPPKPPKPNNPNPKLDLVAIRPAEQPPITLQPDPAPALEALPDEPQAITTEPPQAQAQVETKALTVKPLPLETGKPKPRERRLDDSPKPKPRQFESCEEEELPPQQCQRMKFTDCDKEVGRVIYECYHCLTELVSEYKGSPVLEEFRGRRKEKAIEVECLNCGKSAIRLSVKEVISTVIIASPWE